MGVTYHANYLVWFEVGRTDWLRESGWTYRDMEEAGVSLPVIEVFCQYHQPGPLRRRTRDSDAGDAADPGADPLRLRGRPAGRRHRSASGHSVHAALNRPDALPAARARAEMLDRPAGQPRPDRLQLRLRAASPVNA
jgi:hypothetical protein